MVYLVDDSLVSAFNIDASELEKEEASEISETSDDSEVADTDAALGTDGE